MPLPAAGEENLQTGCLEPDSSCFFREIFTPYPYALTLHVYPIPYSLYPLLRCSTLYTLYPIPYTLYPIPYTLYPIPYTLYPHCGCEM
jgi:hypothetical protein